MTALPDDVRALFAGRNFAHLATVGPEGPSVVPIWIDVEGEGLIMFTQSGSRKARHIRHDDRVALSVVDRADPYRQADVRGRVVEVRGGDEGQAVADRLGHKYTGAPFPWRSPNTVGYVIAVDRARFMKLPFED